MKPDVDQVLLRRWCGDAGDRPDLRIAQLPATKQRVELGSTVFFRGRIRTGGDLVDMQLITKKHTTSLASLTCALALCLGACAGSDEEFEGDDLRHVYFDSDELAAALAQDPDTVFFADLRPGNVLHFERGHADFEFDSFLAQCPSMAAPVPMPVLLDSLDLDLDEYSVWVMYSAETAVDLDANGFRAVADGGGGGGCYLRCNAEGTDCIEVCN